jgi:hypothetical protein
MREETVLIANSRLSLAVNCSAQPRRQADRLLAIDGVRPSLRHEDVAYSAYCLESGGLRWIYFKLAP